MDPISDLNFERCIARIPPEQAALWGFRTGERGTHTSRTIMLEELSQLLDTAPVEASRLDYAHAIVADNFLGKRTVATRKLSLQRLRELYGLDRRLLLFRVLRDLWAGHESSRPLLAMLLALARDPLLRATTQAVTATPIGHEFRRQTMKNALADVAGERLNEAVLDKVVRNASSSWTQSGHLQGRGRKTRQRVDVTPAAATYALLLGYVVGYRGHSMLETPWAAVLDSTPGALMEAAADAKRLGLIELKQSGQIIDISFPTIFTEKERALIRGPYRQVG